MVYLRYFAKLIIFLSLRVFCCGQKLVLAAILRSGFSSSICYRCKEMDMLILGNREGYISSNNKDLYKYFVCLLLCDAFQDFIFFRTQKKKCLDLCFALLTYPSH